MPSRFVILALATLTVAGLRAAPTPPALYPDKDFDSALGRVNDVVFSSDGRLLGLAGARGYGIWDAQTGNSIRKDPAAAQRLAFGGQGTLVALGGDDGRVTVVDLRSGTGREAAKHAKTVTAIAFNTDGRVGASGDSEGNILLWDPDRGVIGPLADGAQKKEPVLVLAFSGASLLSVTKDLRVVTWDVSSKRAIRRSTLQSEVRGRVVVPSSAASDVTGDRLLLGAQLVSEPRGGALAGRNGPARPEDLRRDNVLLPYRVSSGISVDPVKTNEFAAEHVALGPGACFAFFSSYYRNQARLHAWGLVEQGDDLTRVEAPQRIAALAVEPGGHLAATVSENGQVRTWRVSGATSADCDAYVKKSAPQTGPTITLGSETEPLIKAGPGVKIAVLRFDATGVEPGLGDAVAEMVAGELSNNPQIAVVERTAINSILKEMELQRSGLTAADAVKIGQGLNARQVLFGGVRRFGESTYVITARSVDVQTQRVEGSREVTCENCKEQDLPRAVAALRRTIAP